MKALRTKLSTYAIALLLSFGFASPSTAGSSDFSGIYGALWASAGGAEIDGSHTARDDTTTAVTLQKVKLEESFLWEVTKLVLTFH